MKSILLTGHGGNETVQLGERPMPPADQGNVLVRVKAATLNRVDLYMRNSGAGITHTLPQIMGVDGAGVIEQVDAPGTGLAPGQEVVLYPCVSCGHCEFCRRGESVLCTSARTLGEHRDGTLADYIRVPAGNVFPKPATLDFTEAAALGVNYLTAWRMLFTKARVQPWETVLIIGIGGGVSLAALQLARLAGCRTLVTSRDDGKLRRAAALGANHTINSATGDIIAEVKSATGGRGVDVVIENVGTAVWSSVLKSVVRGGRIVTCGATSGDQPPADLRRVFIRQIQILGSTLGTPDEFRHLLDFVERAGLHPVIHARYGLADIHAALDELEAGRQFGKVAVQVG